jgi:hypothetical protein
MYLMAMLHFMVDLSMYKDFTLNNMYCKYIQINLLFNLMFIMTMLYIIMDMTMITIVKSMYNMSHVVHGLHNEQQLHVLIVHTDQPPAHPNTFYVLHGHVLHLDGLVHAHHEHVVHELHPEQQLLALQVHPDQLLLFTLNNLMCIMAMLHILIDFSM